LELLDHRKSDNSSGNPRLLALRELIKLSDSSSRLLWTKKRNRVSSTIGIPLLFHCSYRINLDILAHLFV